MGADLRRLFRRVRSKGAAPRGSIEFDLSLGTNETESFPWGPIRWVCSVGSDPMVLLCGGRSEEAGLRGPIG